MITLGKRRQNCPQDLGLMMGNSLLERVRSIKYLGVFLDEKFNWQAHVSYISKKLACSVGVLTKLRYYTNMKTLLMGFGLMGFGLMGCTF